MRSRPPSRGQPQLGPVITELLRTCVHPPSLLLRVERISEEELPNTEAEKDHEANTGDDYEIRKAYRLILSDGELIIQAALRQALHDLAESETISEGSLVDLKKFKIARAKRKNGNGEVVYLGIEDLEVVGTTVPQPRPPEISASAKAGGFVPDEATEEGGFVREDNEIYRFPESPLKKQRLNNDVTHIIQDKRPLETDLDNMTSSVPSSQESEGFETAAVDEHAIAQRRHILKELGNNSRLSEEDRSEAIPSKRRKFKPSSPIRSGIQPHVEQGTAWPSQAQGTLQEVEVRPPTPPAAPLHNLAYLLKPPIPLPPRNYVCSIFAVVSWVSNSIIHKQPFPAKRHIKIHDPSVSSRRAGVTLAVFVDAKNFIPKVGTIALFRGLTMQRWVGEVILNAYASLKDREESWFVEDPEELRQLGHDVDGMTAWWENRKT